jgi:hypothetical protein
MLVDALNQVRIPPLPYRTPTYLKLLWMRAKSEEIVSDTIMERRVTMLISAPTLVIDISSCKPRKRGKYIQKIEDRCDPDLDDYYVEDWFTKDQSRD